MVLRSTVRAVSEIERSSGGCTRGAATMAVSNPAIAPVMTSDHRSSLKGSQTSQVAMIFLQISLYRELCNTEYWEKQDTDWRWRAKIPNLDGPVLFAESPCLLPKT